MTDSNSEIVVLLEERIAVLEQQVKEKDEQLHVEQGLNSRLRSKVKKLFKSLKKRNKVLSQTRANLAVAQQTLKSREEEELLLPLSVNISSACERHRASLERKQRRKEAQAQKLLEDQEVEQCGEEDEMTIEERAELISQMQDQIAETRERYVRNSVEVAELKEKRKRGEEDLDVLESTSNGEAQREALNRELQDKEKLGLRLVKRVFNLQMQVAEHQGYIEDEAEEEELKRCSSGGSTGSPGGSDDEGNDDEDDEKKTAKEATTEKDDSSKKDEDTEQKEREREEGPAAADAVEEEEEEEEEEAGKAETPEPEQADVSKEGDEKASKDREEKEEDNNSNNDKDKAKLPELQLPHASSGSETSSPDNSSDFDSDEEEAERDRALVAFLVAAGPAAEPILERKALLGAFKAAPPCLKGDHLSRCTPEEQAQVISLFAAWCTTARQTECLLLDSVALGTEALESLRGTLESCGPKISEWDMSMCSQAWHPSRREILLDCIGSQPLKQLFLTNNYLGSRGVKPLVARFPNWSTKMYHLGLEMNSLQDAGFSTLEESLLAGSLPHLKVLDLRWNNLTDKSKDGLARLLQKTNKIEEAPTEVKTGKDSPVPKLKLGEKPADKRITTRALPKLQALLLGGNKLTSEGASEVALSALQLPGDKLDLDLSANKIDHSFVKPLTQWVCRVTAGTTLNVALNLEQNFFDDNELLLELTEALGRQRLRSEQPGRPLLKASKNELQDIDRSDILTRSGGLVRL